MTYFLFCFQKHTFGTLYSIQCFAPFGHYIDTIIFDCSFLSYVRDVLTHLNLISFFSDTYIFFSRHFTCFRCFVNYIIFSAVFYLSFLWMRVSFENVFVSEMVFSVDHHHHHRSIGTCTGNGRVVLIFCIGLLFLWLFLHSFFLCLSSNRFRFLSC